PATPRPGSAPAHPGPTAPPVRRGNVLLICAEDDPADTIAPRLLAAGADVRRVHLLRAARVTRADGEEATVAFDLANVDLIRDALARLPECRLVVIDPIGSYLGGGVDAHRDNEVRSVLAPLGLLAAEVGVAVLLVGHTRKAAADFADDAVLGSRAFTGLARAVLHLIPDPEDRNRKLLLPGKCNLSVPAAGLAYRIAGEPPRLEWEEAPLELHADDLMPKSGGSAKRGPKPEQREAATEWLGELLAGGPMAVTEIQSEAKDAGLAWATVRRAQRALNIKPRKTKVFGGGWVWELPVEDVQNESDGRRRPREDEPEHLRDNPDETTEKAPSAPEGTQVSDNLDTFGVAEGAHPADPPPGHLFDNSATNLPD
ncbi:MAG: AAA family ATPase, partial [Gemmataceae bacterium]|nr:AAA family ATPase [Gemmataceae bacterium]